MCVCVAWVALDFMLTHVTCCEWYLADTTLSASVTANHPINPNLGVFYFEVTIDHKGKGSAISIGIASKSLRKNCQIGKSPFILLSFGSCPMGINKTNTNSVGGTVVDHRLGFELLGISQ